jgi:hypothetical protein
LVEETGGHGENHRPASYEKEIDWMVIDGHFEGSFSPILSTSSVAQLITLQLLSIHHPWVNSADRSDKTQS